MENEFLPIGNILLILEEYKTLLPEPSSRILSNPAQLIFKKFDDLINKSESPSIKSRSASNSNLPSELQISLLQLVKNTKKELELFFEEVTPHAMEAALTLNSGYGIKIQYNFKYCEKSYFRMVDFVLRQFRKNCGEFRTSAIFYRTVFTSAKCADLESVKFEIVRS